MKEFFNRYFIQVGCELWCTLRNIARRCFEDNCQSNAASLSFTTVLALVPLVAVVFSSLSAFPVFEEWSSGLEDFIYDNFVPAAGEVVRNYLSQFRAQAGKLTAVGLAFLIVSALMLLFTIEETFNKIFRVRRRRSLIQRVVAYWAVLTLGPLLIGASLSLSSYLISLAASEAATQSAILRWLPFVFEVMAFLLLYVVVPNREIPIRNAFVGAVVGAVLFEAAKSGFAYYVVNFRSYEVIYGALATIPIFLIWIYVSWLVILLGAVVVAVLLSPEESEQAATET